MKFLFTFAVSAFSILFSCVVPAFGGSTQKTSETAPKIVFLDYFNLEAMRAGSEVGAVILEYLEHDLRTSPDTKNITAKAVSVYGQGFLNTIREFTSAKVVSHDETCSLGFACIVSNPKLPLPKFPQAEHISIDQKTFSKLPNELVHLFPERFLNKELSVFARNSENALILLACCDAEKELLTEKFSSLRTDTEQYKKIPGILIYRLFPRREVQNPTNNTLCPTIPSGEFYLLERDGKLDISVAFHCLSPEEVLHLTLFFSKFNKALQQAAQKEQNPIVQSSLSSVADSMTISSKKNLLTVKISCTAEEFPDFFRWRNSSAQLSAKGK